MSETAIKVENLYKEYKLGVIGHGTLYRDMQSWWAKVRGKEDPNSLISLHHGREAEKDSFLALDDVSFEVKEGDRLGIIGKNGAGKSTLLKILSLITSPSKGTVTIHGKVGSLLEVGTGFHAELTGRENIYLNGLILGMNRREISRKLDEIVDFAGIEKHLDTPVKRYSSGMMVRLGFAVAAHLDTDILIADEVLAVGDAEFQKKALDKMGDLSTGEGRTVLFVSHNMGAVKKLCNYGIVLERGEIGFRGDINDCIIEYTQSFGKLEENKSERCYDADEAKPFQVEKVEILNKNSLQMPIYEAQEEIKVRIHCISRKPIPNLYGYFALKNKDYEPLINCDSIEDGNDVFNNMPTGQHIVDILIPPGILAFGEYIPVLNFTSNYTVKFNVDSPMEVLKFKVVDTISRRGNNRNALTSLILNWRLKNE
jgi:lipopolysaccharide transport system ATP-binding protein